MYVIYLVYKSLKLQRIVVIHIIDPLNSREFAKQALRKHIKAKA